MDRITVPGLEDDTLEPEAADDLTRRALTPTAIGRNTINRVTDVEAGTFLGKAGEADEPQPGYARISISTERGWSDTPHTDPGPTTLPTIVVKNLYDARGRFIGMVPNDATELRLSLDENGDYYIDPNGPIVGKL